MDGHNTPPFRKRRLVFEKVAGALADLSQSTDSLFPDSQISQQEGVLYFTEEEQYGREEKDYVYCSPTLSLGSFDPEENSSEDIQASLQPLAPVGTPKG